MIGRKRLKLDESWCKGCGICVAFCPRQVLELYEGRVRIKNEEQCVSCGQCALRCPDYAIYLVNVEE